MESFTNNSPRAGRVPDGRNIPATGYPYGTSFIGINPPIELENVTGPCCRLDTISAPVI